MTLALLAACAPTLPSTGQPLVRALVRDVARVVDTRDQIGWTVDDIDVRDVLPDALASACRVDGPARAEALRWLAGAIDEAGGDPAAAWLANGKDLDALEDLLLLFRTRLVLAEADRWAAEGKCPFHWPVDPGFVGLQSVARRFVFSAEGGGRFYSQWEDGALGFGGGGATRILGGWGLDDDHTLLAGIEIGGAGRFTDLELGERIEIPEVIFIAALPIQLRRHGLSDHVDVELGPVAYLNQLRGDPQVGVRTGAGMGVSRLRLKGVLPTVTFGVSYDFIPAQRDLPQVHQFTAGVRAGVLVPF